MIVWGGWGDGGDRSTGGVYDPALNAWTAVAPAGAPAARHFHTGLWTGDALVVWGGLADAYGSYTSTGGLYVPPLDVIFADGFESGDTGTWSFTLP